MLGEIFDHRTLRRYVIAFGTLFNDLHVRHRDSNGNVIETIKVPLAYAPRDKMISRLEQNPDMESQAITLPRMSFEMINMSYAPERKLPKAQKIVRTMEGENTLLRTVYSPVPYDINIQLNIYVKYAEDGTGIAEQIMPFFTPEFTMSMRLIDDMDFVMDIPLVLQSVISEDTYDGDFESRRAVIWTFDFMMKSWLFGPTNEQKMIKQAEVSTYLDTLLAVKHSQTTTTPGLTAGGQPTSNASLSVTANNISANSNYGYVNSFEEYFDGSG